jgi:predicted nucleotidyltransferase
VAGTILYGSRARGTYDPDSDADVLLKGEHLRFMPVKSAMDNTTFDVLLETDIFVSPLPVWMEEWEPPEAWGNGS